MLLTFFLPVWSYWALPTDEVLLFKAARELLRLSRARRLSALLLTGTAEE